MNEREYNEAEGIRRSDLWRMEESPEKFKYFLDHPAESTPALVFGAAAHKMVLESKGFEEEYAVAPNVDRRKKEGKEIWERFVEENTGKTVISTDDMLKINEMNKAIGNCKLAVKLLTGKGVTEEAFFWTDPETGEKCKIKVDRMVTWKRRKYVIDYKTSASAETNRFNSSIWKYGYQVQAAMYTEGVMRSKKMRKRPGFLFVVQEKEAPYSVNVIEVSEEVMNAGDAKFHQLLEKYHACRVADQWPGYVGDVPNDAFVPTWMEREMEDEM